MRIFWEKYPNSRTKNFLHFRKITKSRNLDDIFPEIFPNILEV